MTEHPNRSFVVREAGLDDAPAIAALFRRSREAAMPWLPVLHTPAQDLAFFGSQVQDHLAWVVQVQERVVGFAVAGEGWLHHLYIEPQLRGAGFGSALVSEAQRAFPTGLRLWVFEQNQAARSFYAARGFVEIDRTDGSGNEERHPDILMRWVPRAQPPISERTA